MIELALRSHLAGLAPLTAIVGPRVYVDLSPQNAPLPRVVLRLMAGARREYHATGATNLVFADVECTIQAAQYETCGAIYDVIRTALDKFSGTWDGTSVDVSRITPPYSKLELPGFGDEQGVSTLIATVEVAYREE